MRRTFSLSLVTLIIFLIFFALFKSCSVAYGQTIPVTIQEMEQFAQNNLERIAYLKLNKLNEQEIDSLEYQNKLLSEQIQLKLDNIVDYKEIIQEYKSVEEIRVSQVGEYKTKSEADDKTIKKQNRRLNFWRIFTPAAVTALAVVTIIK